MILALGVWKRKEELWSFGSLLASGCVTDHISSSCASIYPLVLPWSHRFHLVLVLIANFVCNGDINLGWYFVPTTAVLPHRPDNQRPIAALHVCCEAGGDFCILPGLLNDSGRLCRVFRPPFCLTRSLRHYHSTVALWVLSGQNF